MKPLANELGPEFLARWEEWYSLAPPVGFLLREAYPERWLRIHALPHEKRFPDSGFDFAQVSRRFNAAANEVLGDTSVCALVFLLDCTSAIGLELSTFGSPVTRLQDLGQLGAQYSDSEDGIFTVPMCLRAAATVWRRGAFDQLFAAGVTGQVRALLVEQERGQVFAPYEGGADLIFATSWERDAAKKRLAAWISPRDDGL